MVTYNLNKVTDLKVGYHEIKKRCHFCFIQAAKLAGYLPLLLCSSIEDEKLLQSAATWLIILDQRTGIQKLCRIK